MPLAQGDILGHYKIQSMIGRGGMGEVYRALDMKLEREVAIKVLPAVGEASNVPMTVALNWQAGLKK